MVTRFGCVRVTSRTSGLRSPIPLNRVDQSRDTSAGDEDTHDAHEWLEHRMATHRLHHAHRADDTGDKENDESSDERESL